MTHVVCESKLRLVVRSSMHPCPGNWVAIGMRSHILPRPPTHLVQELNVGTVPTYMHIYYTAKNYRCHTVDEYFGRPFCCLFAVRCYSIGRRMFLCTFCALEHLCTDRQPNICAQTVDDYFGRQFAVRLCTNSWRIFRTSICCPFVHKRLTDISEQKGKENSMKITKITF